MTLVQRRSVRPSAIRATAAATATETLRAGIEATNRCYPDIVRLRIFAVAVLSAAALVSAAHGTVRTHDGPSTTAPDLFLNIHVTITDTRITIKPRTALRGAEARFIINNNGLKRHNFTIGGTVRQAATQTGFSRMIAPKEEKVLLVYLDYRGPLPYRSTLPADRSLPGMRGIFKVV